ncbi:MAG: hypothetical protein JHC33_00425 [Ignisphaera sp.]|nr:hypothetical protein [Ignisphaera sp.]
MGLSKGFEGKKKSSGRIEDGTYVARIVQLIDLGMQEIEWEGEKKQQQKVFITFEFPTERVEVDGVDRPRWLSKDYTVSLSEKAALYKLLKAVDPDGKITSKGRNVKAILGLPIMIEVGSTSTGNAKIISVARPMKGMPVGELENPTTFFDLDYADKVIFDKLPKWLQDKITNGIDFSSSVFEKEIDDLDQNPF